MSIPWFQPQTSKRERDLLMEVFDSNFLNDGEYTLRFEQELARRLDCKHVISFTSGTTALFGSLIALGIGHGDEVIVPDITFIATANAVTMAGATPVLVDVEPKRLAIDPEKIKEAITDKTKAIIPVHLSGRSAGMKAIMKIADDHNLVVIEDAAEALLSKEYGRCLGTIGHSGCFSFSPMKTITSGQGGAIATNDDQLFTKLWELKDQGRPIRGTGGNDIHVSAGFNFKFTNLQAAIGLGQLEVLDQRVSRMKEIYHLYQQHLEDVEPVQLIGFDIENGESPQWIDAFVLDRQELVDYLKQQEIDCRCFWYPLHTQKPYYQTDEAFPNGTQLSEKALWLPSAFTMTDGDVEKVCDHIRKYYAWKSWLKEDQLIPSNNKVTS